MRENRTSGSEGGGAELNRLSLPLSCSYGFHATGKSREVLNCVTVGLPRHERST
jgi:hypothetical protein